MTKIKNILIYIFALCLLFFPLTIKAIDVSNLEVVQNGQTLTVRQIEAVENLEQTRDAQDQFFVERYGKYITVITFITGIATITMMGIFIMHIVKFAITGTEHWIVRRTAMFGMLWSAVATALLGSATLIMGLAFNVFSW